MAYLHPDLHNKPLATAATTLPLSLCGSARVPRPDVCAGGRPILASLDQLELRISDQI